MKTISIDQHNNCFNLIRLFACISVLLFHLGNCMDIHIPIIDTLTNPLYGVPVFFLISGFLIWLSLERNDGFFHFCTKRVLRLYPELWLSVLVEICFLLCLYGGTIIGYLKLLFFQGLLAQPYTPQEFAGYGIGTLNYSLWAIPIIIQFYFLIWCFHRWLKNKSIYVWIGVIILCIAIGVLCIHIDIINGLPSIVKYIIGLSVGYHLWIFMIGSFVAKFFNKLIPLLSEFWYVPFLALIIYEVVPMPIGSIVPYSLTGVVLLALFIFGFAYRFPNITIKTDISYSVYLIHMVFANAVIHLGYKGNVIAFAIIIAGTLIYAYMSTKLIAYLKS